MTPEPTPEDLAGWCERYAAIQAAYPVDAERLRLSAAALRSQTATLTVLSAFVERDDYDSLHWRKREDGLHAGVNCNDAFYWATADVEEVTPENLPVYVQAYTDCDAAECPWHAGLLFCCRVRGMRPQGAMYRHLDEAVWPLFDAAGPERTTDAEPFGNPVPEEKVKKERTTLRADLAAARSEVARLRAERDAAYGWCADQLVVIADVCEGVEKDRYGRLAERLRKGPAPREDHHA